MRRSGLCPDHSADVYAQLVSKAAEYRRRQSVADLEGNVSHAAHWRCFAEEHERHALRYAALVVVRP